MGFGLTALFAFATVVLRNRLEGSLVDAWLEKEATNFLEFKRVHPEVPTKSGLMVGLGEADEEILAVMRDLRAHDVDMLTIGQYLQPSPHHLPVERYVEPAVFVEYEKQAAAMGFRHAAIGPLVRSSYHADQQAHAAGL